MHVAKKEKEKKRKKRKRERIKIAHVFLRSSENLRKKRDSF